jgi:hypothetical protein
MKCCCFPWLFTTVFSFARASRRDEDWAEGIQQEASKAILLIIMYVCLIQNSQTSKAQTHVYVK